MTSTKPEDTSEGTITWQEWGAAYVKHFLVVLKQIAENKNEFVEISLQVAQGALHRQQQLEISVGLRNLH